MLPLVLRVLGFDFDEILMICTGLAAVAWVIFDYKREKDQTHVLLEHESRLSRMEATVVDNIQVEQRIAALEVKAELEERLEERISGYAERIAILETRLEAFEGEDEDDAE